MFAYALQYISICAFAAQNCRRTDRLAVSPRRGFEAPAAEHGRISVDVVAYEPAGSCFQSAIQARTEGPQSLPFAAEELSIVMSQEHRLNEATSTDQGRPEPLLSRRQLLSASMLAVGGAAIAGTSILRIARGGNPATANTFVRC